MSRHVRKKHPAAPRLGWRALAAGTVTGACLAATLGLSTGQAMAATTAQVKAGTLQITGDAASDTLALAPASPTTLLLDVGADGTADFTFDRSTFTAVDVDARGGDDRVDVLRGAGGALPNVTVDGGGGEDALNGGDGAEVLIGGGGDDSVDGNLGADVARLGSGADRFQWDPGDGSDTVDGQGGGDALDFNGSNASERIDLSRTGSHVRLFRDVAAITMDLDDIERTGLRTLSGADTVTVDDLSGTDLKRADIDLGATGGGGDTQADTVIASGTNRRDTVDVIRSGSQVLATGLPARLAIAGSEAGNDALRVNTLGGDDRVRVAPDVGDLIATFVDLGAGE